MFGKECLALEQVTKLNITKLIEADAFLIKETPKSGRNAMRTKMTKNLGFLGVCESEEDRSEAEERAG